MPIAVAEHLLADSTPAATDTPPSESTEGDGADAPAADSPITDEKVRGLLTLEGKLKCADWPFVFVQLPPDAGRVNESVPADSTAGGLLRFLNSYPNPLTRFTAPGGRSRPVLRTLSGSNASLRPANGAGREPAEAANGARHQQVALLPAARAGATTYPLSTVLIAALIAFLIGSLLRSMLSPADFVYVVSDIRDVESEGVSALREIKRLVEVKYLVGGWDFQVALVRRQ